MGYVLEVNHFKRDFFSILDTVISDDECMTIATGKGNVIIMSEERYKGLLETAYLLTDPTFMSDVEEAERTHDEAVDWRS